jgi:hypothetical protein
MLAAVPLLLLPVLAYNIAALLVSDAAFHTLDAAERLGAPLFTVPMASGASWPVSVSDLLVFAALAVLFVELLKSTSSRKAAVVNHSLSMLLFVVCLVEFLLFEAFATSTFFLIGSMVLLDVLAGFTVSLMGARRDVDVG